MSLRVRHMADWWAIAGGTFQTASLADTSSHRQAVEVRTMCEKWPRGVEATPRDDPPQGIGGSDAGVPKGVVIRCIRARQGRFGERCRARTVGSPRVLTECRVTASRAGSLYAAGNVMASAMGMT